MKPGINLPRQPIGGISAVLLAASLLALAGCLDNRNAGGTGTATGNTVSARVVLPGGAPAAGARVTLYPVEFVPKTVPGAVRGAPSPKTALTDSAGRFTLETEAGSAYLLEGTGTPASDSLTVWRNDIYLREDEAATDLGTLSLEISGVLSGTVSQPDSASTKEIWAGFPGTDRFTKVDGAGGFRLEGIPPGRHNLLLIRDPGKTSERIKVSGWHLAPGAHGKLDTVTLGKPTAGESNLLRKACVEDPVRITEYPYEGPAVADRRDRLRSILETNPPQWIEIDLCLGTWRTKGTLPAEAVTFSGTMSSHESDFLPLEGKGWTMKIDSNGRVSQFPELPTSLLSATFYRGKVYALFINAVDLKIYPDEAAFLLNQPEASLALPFPTGAIRDLVIADSVAYFVEDNVNPKYHVLDLRSGTYGGFFNLAGFEGDWFSFTSAPGGMLWNLNYSGLIQLGDPATRSIIRKLKVVIPKVRLRGLTRYQGVDSE
ncbi:MAG: hypothetical protein ABIW76_05245 [Fibrobacteria bacterium]